MSSSMVSSLRRRRCGGSPSRLLPSGLATGRWVPTGARPRVLPVVAVLVRRARRGGGPGPRAISSPQ